MKPCRLVIVVITVGTLVGACGTKGPLYVPGVPADASWPYAKPASPARPTDRKPAEVPPSSDERR